MILSPKLGHSGFTTWHCEECRIVKGVRWVDTDTAQWGEIAGLDRVNNCVIETKHQAKRIDVLLNQKLVLINPLQDDEDADSSVQVIRQLATV